MPKSPSIPSDSIFEELSKYFAPKSIVYDVERLRAWRSRLELDTSFGRIINGPHWIDGTSISNGTITAEKITVPHLEAINANTGHLVVTGSLLASSNPGLGFPGALIESSGRLRIRNASGTTVIDFNPGANPLATLGVGTTAVTISSTGVVSIPAGAIAGGLTIANIASGQMGGTYYTNTNESLHPNLKLSTSGITMTNSVGTTIFSLAAGSGSFSMVTGPTTAQRVEITNSGIYLMPAFVTDTNSALVSISPSGFIIRSAVSGSRIQLTSSGLSAFSGTAETVRISSDGRFELASATSGSRVVISTTAGSDSSRGIFVFNASNTLVAALRADGSGVLGIDAITWTAGGNPIIKGSRLESGSVTGTAIATNTITASNIASETITGEKIQASTITANKLNINQLSAIAGETGSLTVTSSTITFTNSSLLNMQCPAAPNATAAIRLDYGTTHKLQITATSSNNWIGSYSGHIYMRLPNTSTIMAVVDIDGIPGFRFNYQGFFAVYADYPGAPQLQSITGNTPPSYIGRLKIHNAANGADYGWIPVYQF